MIACIFVRYHLSEVEESSECKVARLTLSRRFTSFHSRTDGHSARLRDPDTPRDTKTHSLSSSSRHTAKDGAKRVPINARETELPKTRARNSLDSPSRSAVAAASTRPRHTCTADSSRHPRLHGDLRETMRCRKWKWIRHTPGRVCVAAWRMFRRCRAGACWFFSAPKK